MDKEHVLRGPEIQVAKTTSVGEKARRAIAYCDMFDKKGKENPMLFEAGFTNVETHLSLGFLWKIQL
jgi:hypothetical protein